MVVLVEQVQEIVHVVVSCNNPGVIDGHRYSSRWSSSPSSSRTQVPCPEAR
jgi:hypothetical protein